MATWPATLPRPNISGYTLKPVDASVRTDMESGAARARRRTSAKNDKLTVNWTFTDAQMAIFRTWFDNPAENAGGASWFTVSLARGTTGVVSLEARLVGPFQASVQSGLNWNVSAELELR